MVSVPFALFLPTTARCLVAMGCLHILTCSVPTANRMVACPSVTTPAFLTAFLRGEVDRLVVVEHLATAPDPKTASGWIPEAIKDLFGFRRS